MHTSSCLLLECSLSRSHRDASHGAKCCSRFCKSGELPLSWLQPTRGCLVLNYCCSVPSHLFQHDLLTCEFLPKTAFAPNSSWDLRADDSFVSVSFPMIPRQTLLLVQTGARLHSGGTYFVVLGRPRASTWKKLKDSEIQHQKAQLYIAWVLIGLNNISPSQILGKNAERSERRRSKTTATATLSLHLCFIIKIC